MKVSALIIFFLSIVFSVHAQTVFTISGTVQDGETGEKLIGATVYESQLQKGTGTNVYGFYSLSLAAETVELSFSYVGYEPQKFRLTLTADTRLEVSLKPVTLLGEAVIESESDSKVEESQMSTITLDMSKVASLPVLLGERDVLKTLQLLPGVQSGTEGASGIYVRGGGPDQNLILLDGVPVYNASHLFGFFSVFNSDAIRNVELIKGGFPARYGGRTSSVIDIRMKEGNSKEFKGEGSIGLISSKLTLEGPIWKDRTSFLVSGRRTYIDFLTRPIIAANAENAGGGYYFYDLNGKINHKINDDNRLFLSLYHGKDRAYINYSEQSFGYTEKFESDLSWGNSIVALRWNNILSPKLFANYTATYSRYKFSTSFDFRTDDPNANEFDATNFTYFSGINDFGAKADFDFFPKPDHYIRFGGGYTYHVFSPGVNENSISDQTSSTTFRYGSADVYANEVFSYAEDDWRVSEKFKINVGLHHAAFFVQKRTYQGLQPRLSGRYLINKKLSIKGSYARMYQFLHLLTNVGIGLPTDLWLPATDAVKPQISDQVALGVSHDIGSDYALSGEVYYKWMQNLIEYKDGASFQGTGTNWENLVESGDGTAYGLELLLEKKRGALTGWIGYTLSWSWRDFENLNFGEPFYYRYDRRHDIGAAATYTVSDRFDFGVVWVYGTGNAISLPTTRFNNYPNIPSIDPEGNMIGPYNDVDYFENRNDYRMPAYHRLDIVFNLHKKTKYGERTWNLGLYNAYNRQNPFFLYFSTNEVGERGLFQISLFPVLPAITYNFKF